MYTFHFVSAGMPVIPVWYVCFENGASVTVSPSSTRKKRNNEMSFQPASGYDAFDVCSLSHRCKKTLTQLP